MIRAAIGILGGTFDPVHHGHLRLALELHELLRLNEIRLIPLANPPHREQPVAPIEARLAMLQAAVKNESALRIDPREIERGGNSYTIDTLRSLRAELPDTPLCLILGMDAFTGLPNWKRWENLCDFAHLLVAHRPGANPPEDLRIQKLLSERLIDTPEALHESLAGHIYLASLPLLDISSSRIRAYLAQGRSPRYLIPDAVLDVINTQHLYHTN